MNYIRSFTELSLQDRLLVGGKGAALGQLTQHLMPQGILVPQGFVVTTKAYQIFLEINQLTGYIQNLLQNLDHHNLQQLEFVGKTIRDAIVAARIPHEIEQEIIRGYKVLEAQYGSNCDVAVRSSATAEDSAQASFAGQQESYLNIFGIPALLQAWKKCCASLFTNRAISYRIDRGFEHGDMLLAVVVQKMVRSDGATSGVLFTVDTETGFDQVIYLTASYGLGEMVVGGAVNPDEFYLHKDRLVQGFVPILKKRKGSKLVKMVYDESKNQATKIVKVLGEDQNRFCLSDAEILILGRYALLLEAHYKKEFGHFVPLDIEWAKDAVDGKLYIVQVRPETVHSLKNNGLVVTQYQFEPNAIQNAKILAVGKSVGKNIVTGVARVVFSVRQMHQVQSGEIIVTDMTDPDWEPVMKISGGIITNRGGRTCHAAIVSRELGIGAIVGTTDGTERIKTGDLITLESYTSDQGFVYQGALAFTKTETTLTTISNPGVSLMLNVANPDEVFGLTSIPNQGVGLLRLEFIINNAIKVHPMALVAFEKVTEIADRAKIEELTFEFADKKQFFVDKLAQEVATIAAAFYPKSVVVRLSDFKSNEYANLLGGKYFERVEENPMLGFRGASRYYHPEYQDAFALECAAMKKVREEMGFKNVILMVPFVRTVTEARLVIAEMEKHGLCRGVDDLKIYMMCEIPSNVLLIEKFAYYFDGFSIGSNDLTQMVLGVDRDSGVLTAFDERDEAVMMMLKMAIEGAHRAGKPIGICGQAPSDFPEFARMLKVLGINSISLNPDSVIKTMMSLGDTGPEREIDSAVCRDAKLREGII